MRRTQLHALVAGCTTLIVGAGAAADHPTLGIQQDVAAATGTLSAVTMPAGEWSLGFESQYTSNNLISDADLAHYAEQGEMVHSAAGVGSLSINGGWGVNETLTVGFSLPYVSKWNIREGAHRHELDHAVEPADTVDGTVVDHAAADEISELGDARGLGDLTVYGQYRFSGNDEFHVAGLLGMKLPTGNTHLTSAIGERFETEHQPGTGSWDALAGLAMTRQWDGVTLDGNVMYTFAGDGSQSTNLGDIVNYNLALSFRPGRSSRGHGVPGHHSGGDAKGSWDLALEANGEWRDRTTIDAVSNRHTGGNLVFLAQSIRYSSGKGWSAYGSIALPVIENLNGVQSTPRLRFFAGVSVDVGAGN